MKKSPFESGEKPIPGLTNLVERVWERSWSYAKTRVDVGSEPFLILNKDFRVLSANQPFYQTFRTTVSETQGESVFHLGNGQWNNPALKKLLGDILPQKNYFKGFELTHDFPKIGRRVMILNGREIRVEADASGELFSPMILFVMEDVTAIMMLAQTLAAKANELESVFKKKDHVFEVHIGRLEKEISKLKKK